MQRNRLITKEKMENFCNGKDYQKDSVNDDLESLFEDLRREKELNEEVDTYFLTKLTEAELDLVERKDTSYFKTFTSLEPDVEDAEMKLSESESKYVNGFCYRKTFTIENSSYRKFNPFTIENSSENSFEYSSESTFENLSDGSSNKICNCCFLQ